MMRHLSGCCAGFCRGSCGKLQQISVNLVGIRTTW
jgi:hypothetical protein